MELSMRAQIPSYIVCYNGVVPGYTKHISQEGALNTDQDQGNKVEKGSAGTKVVADNSFQRKMDLQKIHHNQGSKGQTSAVITAYDNRTYQGDDFDHHVAVGYKTTCPSCKHVIEIPPQRDENVITTQSTVKPTEQDPEKKEFDREKAQERIECAIYCCRKICDLIEFLSENFQE